jgi:hypothetical protein
LIILVASACLYTLKSNLGLLAMSPLLLQTPAVDGLDIGLVRSDAATWLNAREDSENTMILGLLGREYGSVSRRESHPQSEGEELE